MKTLGLQMEACSTHYGDAIYKCLGSSCSELCKSYHFTATTNRLSYWLPPKTIFRRQLVAELKPRHTYCPPRITILGPANATFYYLRLQSQSTFITKQTSEILIILMSVVTIKIDVRLPEGFGFFQSNSIHIFSNIFSREKNIQHNCPVYAICNMQYAICREDSCCIKRSQMITLILSARQTCVTCPAKCTHFYFGRKFENNFIFVFLFIFSISFRSLNIVVFHMPPKFAPEQINRKHGSENLFQLPVSGERMVLCKSHVN